MTDRVVDRFWALLETEMLESPTGLTIVAGRQETLVDEIHRGIDQIPDRVVEALDGRLARSVADVPGGGDPGLQAQVDAARDLLNFGHPSAARTILEGVVAKLAALPNAALQFRVDTNLGAAALALDDLAVARRHFASALQQQPTSSRALTNMSQLELLEGSNSRALQLARQAWQVQPDSHSAQAMLLALHANGMHGEIDQIARDNLWLDSDPGTIAVLGELDLERERHEEAVSRLRLALGNDPQDPKLMVLLAVAMTREVQARLRDDPPLSWRMLADDRLSLAEVERLLTQAADLLASREPRSSYIETLSLRAALRTMVGRTAEATADAERILGEDVSHRGALQAKGIALLGSDADAAADHLERADARTSGDPALTQALAHAYELSGRLDEAAELLSTIRAAMAGQPEEIDIAGALMRVHWRAARQAEARDIEEELVRTWPTEPSASLVLARFAALRGDDDRAAQLMRQALDGATGGLHDRIRIELAQFSIERRQFADAADLLEPVVDDSSPVEFRQRYAMCLFNAGRLKDALAFTQRQRGSGPSIAIITDIEAEILERISDMRGALGLWEKIANEHPERVSALLRAASAAHTHGDSLHARDLLRRVDERAVAHDAVLLMQLAQLRNALGEPDALPPAYRARRRQFSDPKMHLAYIGIFLWRGGGESQVPVVDVVEVDTTVRLTRGDRSEIRTIEDDEADAARGEITSADPVAKRLMGRRVGDDIVMKARGIEELIYKVAEIKSKYVHAFQDSITRFSTMFPDHPGIDTIEVSNTDISQLLRALDLQSERATAVLKMYADTHIPVAMVARLMGRRPVDVWRGMCSAFDVAIFASTGTSDDRVRELSHAARKGLVLDLSAILTVDELQLWAPLKGLYERVVVAEAVVQEIRDHVREYARMRPTGFAGKVGDRYTMTDATPEQLTSERSHLQLLLSRVEAEVEVVGAPGLLDIPPDQLDRLTAMIGGGSLAAAHIARREELVLYADDLGLRQLARAEWAVDGTWTQPVLTVARQRDLVGEDEYRAALAQLAEWRFHVVELAAADLVALLSVEGAALSPSLVRVAGFAFGKDFVDAYAIALAAEVVRGLWIRPLVSGRKHVLLALVLSSLLRGRDSNQTVSTLLQLLQERVKLLLDRDEIISTVALWVRERNKSRVYEGETRSPAS